MTPRAQGEPSAKLEQLVSALLERVERLEKEVTELRCENAQLKRKVADLQIDNARLRRENAWLKKQLFGPTRERVERGRLHAAWAAFQKSSDDEPTEALPPHTVTSTNGGTALQLILELASPSAETASAQESSVEPPVGIPASELASPPEPPIPPAKPSRRRHAHGRHLLPEHLPVERVVFEPGVIPPGARRIGDEVSEKLGYRRASYVRLLVVRPKYAVDEAFGKTRVVVAEPPSEMIPRGLCDPAMLARIITAKWADHVPWHRLEGIVARDGVCLSSTTMAGVAKRAEPLARHVVDAMWTEARTTARVLAIDATTVKMRAKGKCLRGYPWVVVADRDHVLFGFSMSHTQNTPEALLAGFRGYVLADASSVYDRFFMENEDALEAGCWAHSRRRFFYAAPADERALVGLKLADDLFALERSFKDLPPSERRRKRQVHSRAILDAFQAWRARMLSDVSVDARGPLRNALNYSLRHWTALCRFLDDGHVPIHNNFTELQARHIAVGRNNWLFFGSEPDAKVACTWLSLVASAKLYGLDPEVYLRDLFRVLPGWPRGRVLELAPKYWNATRARLDANELGRPLGDVTVPPRLVATEQAAE